MRVMRSFFWNDGIVLLKSIISFVFPKKRRQALTLNNNLNLLNSPGIQLTCACYYNPRNRRTIKKYKQRYRINSSIDTNCIFPKNLILKIGNVLEILNLHTDGLI